MQRLAKFQKLRKSPLNMEEPKEDNRNSKIFIERGDGLGWTLNFDNKWSYVVLVLILAAVAGCIVWINVKY